LRLRRALPDHGRPPQRHARSPAGSFGPSRAARGSGPRLHRSRALRARGPAGSPMRRRRRLARLAVVVAAALLGARYLGAAVMLPAREIGARVEAPRAAPPERGVALSGARRAATGAPLQEVPGTLAAEIVAATPTAPSGTAAGALGA